MSCLAQSLSLESTEISLAYCQDVGPPMKKDDVKIDLNSESCFSVFVLLLKILYRPSCR